MRAACWGGCRCERGIVTCRDSSRATAARYARALTAPVFDPSTTSSRSLLTQPIFLAMLSATRSLGLRSQARSFSAFSAARFASAAPAQAGGYAAPKSDVGGPAPKPKAAASPTAAAQLPVQHVQREMKISNPRTSKKERLIILGSGWGGFTLVSLHQVDQSLVAAGSSLRRARARCGGFRKLRLWLSPIRRPASRFLRGTASSGHARLALLRPTDAVDLAPPPLPASRIELTP